MHTVSHPKPCHTMSAAATWHEFILLSEQGYMGVSEVLDSPFGEVSGLWDMGFGESNRVLWVSSLEPYTINDPPVVGLGL